MMLFLENIKRRWQSERILLECDVCRKRQEEAFGWHYQQCMDCGYYLFDNRVLS